MKALALRAAAVLIGRPLLYGLAATGEEGASQVLGILQEEMDRTLANMGCAAMKMLSVEHLNPARD